jgi:hypothetical protein
MPTPKEHQHVLRPPDWAVDQATDELYDVDHPHAVTQRAWELLREREDERHDEYDDPDQGGEA